MSAGAEPTPPTIEGSAKPIKRVTLAELAVAKKLPVEWLEAQGAMDHPDGGVAIGYFKEDETDHERHRYRLTLRAKEGSRWLGPKGVPPIAYGIWRLNEARAQNRLFIVNGESDAWALWYHGYPTLGVPGANAITCLQASNVQEIDTIIIVQKSTEPRHGFPHRIAMRLLEFGFEGQIEVVKMPEDASDPSALHVCNPHVFGQEFDKLYANREIAQETKIAAVAKLDRVEYDRQRRIVAKQISIRVSTLDDLVTEMRAALAKRSERSNTQSFRPDDTSTSDDSNEQSSDVQPGSDSDTDGHGAETGPDPDELYEIAQEIIEHPDPLVLVTQAVRDSGYAGDTLPVELAYVSISSRHQSRPINVFFEAPSSAGKNFAIDAAAQLHPEEAYYSLSASSPRALIYNGESFKNRMIILAECDSIPADGPAASAIRAICNDSRMNYETVEKDPETGEFEVRRIMKEGPTGMITAGVRPLDLQMATRTLRASIPDDAQQTLAVLHVTAEAENGGKRAIVEIEKFHAYQRWLAIAGQKRVVVPFARTLVQFMPTGAVRIRRDFRQLLSVIKTVAFLAQKHRDRTPDGAVQANLDDYGHARRLLGPLFDSLSADGLTPAVRETVALVGENEEVSEAKLVPRLKLAKSTVHFRVKNAIRGGWLNNLETKKGRRARLVRGEPMPEQRATLPAVDELRAAFERDSNGRSNPHLDQQTAVNVDMVRAFEWFLNLSEDPQRVATSQIKEKAIKQNGSRIVTYFK